MTTSIKPVRVSGQLFWSNWMGEFNTKFNEDNKKFECSIGMLSDAAATALEDLNIKIKNKPEQGKFIVGKSMYKFEPVDEEGNFLSMMIGHKPFAGKEMMDEIEAVVYRLLDAPDTDGLDLLWYLWSGPRSPLFGKDKITTFERDWIEDAATHHETKNPYFALIHEAWFCEKVLTEFNVDPAVGLIVNGHVPVKLEKGESPLKRCGKAITIDGAFSEAYGDHGYTLVIEPHGTLLALHHHFESVEAAILRGGEIIPTITPVRTWKSAKRVGDSMRGEELRQSIGYLERLIEAYQSNDIPQRNGV